MVHLSAHTDRWFLIKDSAVSMCISNQITSPTDRHTLAVSPPNTASNWTHDFGIWSKSHHSRNWAVQLPYFSIDNAHLVYNPHPKILLYTSTLVLLLHLIYLSYLYNVNRACSFFKNLDLFVYITHALSIEKYGILNFTFMSHTAFLLIKLQWQNCGSVAIFPAVTKMPLLNQLIHCSS